MNVSLVSYSQPAFNTANDFHEGEVEDQVTYCARVSNPGGQLEGKSNRKLITYLIENKHWSPFEMVSICLEIETTRDIARQILRHRSFSFQEFSQRYADPVKELNFEYREARLQDEKNRQNSIINQDIDLEAEWTAKQAEIIDLAEKNYKWARSRNIAKEQARAVLPEGNTMSRLYVNGTLRSWIHYIQLRTDESTQLEHRQIAQDCKNVIAEIFPLIKEL